MQTLAVCRDHYVQEASRNLHRRNSHRCSTCCQCTCRWLVYPSSCRAGRCIRQEPPAQGRQLRFDNSMPSDAGVERVYPRGALQRGKMHAAVGPATSSAASHIHMKPPSGRALSWARASGCNPWASCQDPVMSKQPLVSEPRNQIRESTTACAHRHCVLLGKCAANIALQVPPATFLCDFRCHRLCPGRWLTAGRLKMQPLAR